MWKWSDAGIDGSMKGGRYAPRMPLRSPGTPLALQARRLPSNGQSLEHGDSCDKHMQSHSGPHMKILLWAVFIIFLIGLAVVTGFFKLIF